jgi:hypothetical protein
MNTKIQRSSVKAALIAALLLVAGAFSGPANAQGQTRARFTLPFEVHWGRAVLPPGDYRVRFPSEPQGVLVISDARNHDVAVERTDNQDDSAGRSSALLISTKGREHVVCSLTIAELGETFVYQRAPKHEVQEARRMQTVPVLVAEK